MHDRRSRCMIRRKLASKNFAWISRLASFLSTLANPSLIEPSPLRQLITTLQPTQTTNQPNVFDKTRQQNGHVRTPHHQQHHLPPVSAPRCKQASKQTSKQLWIVHDIHQLKTPQPATPRTQTEHLSRSRISTKTCFRRKLAIETEEAQKDLVLNNLAHGLNILVCSRLYSTLLYSTSVDVMRLSSGRNVKSWVEEG